MLYSLDSHKQFTTKMHLPPNVIIYLTNNWQLYIKQNRFHSISTYKSTSLEMKDFIEMKVVFIIYFSSQSMDLNSINYVFVNFYGKTRKKNQNIL